MRDKASVLTLVALLCLPTSRAHAQAAGAPAERRAVVIDPGEPARAQPASSPEYLLSAWLGLSTSSTTLAPIGAAPDTKLGVLALRLSRRLGATTREQHPSRTWWYTADVIPVAIISPAYVSAPRTPECARRQVCAFPRTDSSSALFPPGSVIGFGLAPFGVTTVFRSPHALQFTLGATGGAMWFTEPVPTTRASQGNFTASVESGVRFATRCGLALSFTYRFHHISNAWLGEENPAVGSHLFSIGMYRGKARRPVDSSAC